MMTTDDKRDGPRYRFRGSLDGMQIRPLVIKTRSSLDKPLTIVKKVNVGVLVVAI